jgi:hypothetical protein
MPKVVVARRKKTPQKDPDWLPPTKRALHGDARSRKPKTPRRANSTPAGAQVAVASASTRPNPRPSTGKTSDKARHPAKHLLGAFTAASAKSPATERLKSQVAALWTPDKEPVAQEEAAAASASAAAALERIFKNIQHIKGLPLSSDVARRQKLRFELGAESTRSGGARSGAPLSGTEHSASRGWDGDGDGVLAGRSLLLSLPVVSETSPNASLTPSAPSPDSLCSPSASPRRWAMSRLGQWAMKGQRKEKDGALERILGTPELKNEDKDLLASIEDLLHSHLGVTAKEIEGASMRAPLEAGSVERGLERLHRAEQRCKGDARQGEDLAGGTREGAREGTGFSDDEFVYDSAKHAPGRGGTGEADVRIDTRYGARYHVREKPEEMSHFAAGLLRESEEEDPSHQGYQHALRSYQHALRQQSSAHSIGNLTDAGALSKDVTIFYDTDLQYLLSSQGGLGVGGPGLSAWKDAEGKGEGQRVTVIEPERVTVMKPERDSGYASGGLYGERNGVREDSGAGGAVVGVGCENKNGHLKLAARAGSEGRPPRAPIPPPFPQPLPFPQASTPPPLIAVAPPVYTPVEPVRHSYKTAPKSAQLKSSVLQDASGEKEMEFAEEETFFAESSKVWRAIEVAKANHVCVCVGVGVGVRGCTYIRICIHTYVYIQETKGNDAVLEGREVLKGTHSQNSHTHTHYRH